MSRIVVLGDLNLDVHAVHPGHLPAGDEARSQIWTTPGGSAGTFARVAARLGADVSFIGCVGNDLAGDLLVRSLEEDGVRSAVVRSDLPTGTILALDQGGDRSMICSRGANDGLNADGIGRSLFDEVDHLHVSGYAILSASQRAAAQRAIAVAQEHGLTISLDPPPSNLIASFGVDAFFDAIDGVIWLYPNRTEGQVLTGLGDSSDVAAIVDILAARFPIGALTLGAAGALAWRQSERSQWAAQQTVNVDPTGAGDAYAAAFTVALLGGEALADANAAGCKTAFEHLQQSHAKRAAG